MIKEINAGQLKKLLNEESEITLRDGGGNTIVLNDEYRQQIYSKKLSPTLFFGNSEKAGDRLKAYPKYPGKIIKREKSKETGETVTLTINADIKDETRGGSFCIRLNRIIVRMGKHQGTWFVAREITDAEELFNNWVNFGESYPLPPEQRNNAKSIAADKSTTQAIDILHNAGVEGEIRLSHNLLFYGRSSNMEWEKGEQTYNNLVKKLSSKYEAEKTWQDPKYQQMKKKWINSPNGSASFMPMSYKFDLGNGAILELNFSIDGTGGHPEKLTGSPTADIVAYIRLEDSYD
jgi:hypothetical protein